MKTHIAVSAPGKLMLLGEHAVVYGRPCLVTAVNQRIKAKVRVINKPVFQLNAGDVGIKNYQKSLSNLGEGKIPSGAKFTELAVLNFKKKYGLDAGIRIETISEFSSKFGFGSSAAVTVCVIKALSELFDKNLNRKEIFDLSYKTVLDSQKKGSGFDVAAAIYGGTLYFITGGNVVRILKNGTLPLVVGYSGMKADTAALIDKVNTLSSQNPKAIEEIYDKITELVGQAEKNIVTKNWEAMGKRMDMNQRLLKKLGVSIPKLDAMIDAARVAGAYGAKLSGAGGGDCMIALVPQNKVQNVERAIEEAGGKIIPVKTCAEGVRVEQ